MVALERVVIFVVASEGHAGGGGERLRLLVSTWTCLGLLVEQRWRGRSEESDSRGRDSHLLDGA
jgi:hypothetical protein